MIPYNLLISCFIYIRLVLTIRIYTTIFENAPPHFANPYISSIRCKRILLIIHYHILFVHFLPSILVTESNTAGIIKKKKSAYGNRRKKKSKTYDVYTAAMASCFIYIRPVHAIRLYTNIFENAPPHCTNPYIPSISCKRILLIIHYHLHQTCPYYQNLHYHFRKCPTPLCKSLHSIDQLQTDSIDYTLSFT